MPKHGKPPAKSDNLFPRVDMDKALAELDKAAADAKNNINNINNINISQVELDPQLEESINFDVFCQGDLRAVKVKSCEAVKKSAKLLKFILDDGTGTDRQILSGIHAFYQPEDLIGKTLAAIVNLPPRKMMGLESNGMILAAVHKENGEEKLNLLILDDKIPAGAKIC